MNNFYLDTNIFLYLSDKQSPYHKACLSLIIFCQEKKFLISTSTETIQEIIHYSKNTKQQEKGILISKNILKLVDEIYSISKTTIEIFLENAQKHQKTKSRDLIHLSACLENKIDKIVTYDREFKAFRGVKILKPQDILEQD